MPKRVVILSGHSLFAEGIASRLRQHPEALDLHIVDPHVPGAIDQVAAAHPSAVIVDATDLEAEQLCPLSSLLVQLPALKVIRLDPQRNQIQVVTSAERIVTEVRDLLEVIDAPA